MKHVIWFIMSLAVINLWGNERNEIITREMKKIELWKFQVTKKDQIENDVNNCIKNCKKVVEKNELKGLIDYCQENVFKPSYVHIPEVKPELLQMLGKLKIRSSSSLSTSVDVQSAKPKSKSLSSPQPQETFSGEEPIDITKFGNDKFVTNSDQELEGQGLNSLNVLEASDLKLQVEKTESRVTLMEDSMNSLHNWALALLLGWVIAAGLILVFLVALRLQAKRVAELEFQLKRLVRK